MKKRILVGLTTAVLLAGCASSQAAAPTPKPVPHDGGNYLPELLHNMTVGPAPDQACKVNPQNLGDLLTPCDVPGSK